MKQELVTTKDGSHSIAVPDLNATYHSMHGAIQESMHVFIEAGLKPTISENITKINIFEMGLGTGLNVLLTYLISEKHQIDFYYESMEAFPLTNEFISQLNYCDQLNRSDLSNVFNKIHHSNWNEEVYLSERFIFRKNNGRLQDYHTEKRFDLIYYDAFAPSAQPELWTIDIFKKLFSLLHINGKLVTYCSKGEVRRNMIAAGFSIEKIPGPPGKREMVRASASPKIS